MCPRSLSLALTSACALRGPEQTDPRSFSAAAWGTIEPANKRGPIGINPKNYELSVFVPGDVLVSLLAPGSVWGDLMTYERPAPPLRPGDKPFGSKASPSCARSSSLAQVWVKNARDDYDDE